MQIGILYPAFFGGFVSLRAYANDECVVEFRPTRFGGEVFLSDVMTMDEAVSLIATEENAA